MRPFQANVTIEGGHALLSVVSRTMARHGSDDGDPWSEPQDEPISINPYLDDDPANADEDALRAAAEEALEDLGYELDEVALQLEAD